ncbi:MAG TPA: hypothetical protein VIJ62_03070, partial [Rhizomicrobium sp.]
MTRNHSFLCAALLAGGSLLAAGAASAQPDGGKNPAPPAPASHPMMHPRPWVHPWHGPAFRFHANFAHFTPHEHDMWVHGGWRHRWWHGHYGWFWYTGGAWYL